VDALKRLPGLLRIYRDVRGRWRQHPPQVFVGIDAPDFNLRLERELKAAGIPTVHFVGPSIWAWRYERIHAIRAAVSHMLVLFPFEVALYEKEGVPVTYVGHPLAQDIPMQPDRQAARAALGLPEDGRVLAVLPGSRRSEIALLAPRFLRAVQVLQQQDADLQIVVPAVNAARRQQFEQLLAQTPVRNLHLLQTGGDKDGAWPASWQAMQAADAVLAASGTATLEAALFKRPMVISYVLSPAMRRLMAWKSGQRKPLLPWVGLPNILLQDFAVPELLQDDATPEKLAQSTWQALTDTDLAQRLHQRFSVLHAELRRDTPALASEVILKLAGCGG